MAELGWSVPGAGGVGIPGTIKVTSPGFRAEAGIWKKGRKSSARTVGRTSSCRMGAGDLLAGVPEFLAEAVAPSVNASVSAALEVPAPGFALVSEDGGEVSVVAEAGVEVVAAGTS